MSGGPNHLPWQGCATVILLAATTLWFVIITLWRL